MLHAIKNFLFLPVVLLSLVVLILYAGFPEKKKRLLVRK